ncbi:nuclear transport factor 2 family protein [Kitasatospora sp. NPDC048365]|uniref:nuclear transport factor 2 family protein n=1 Tax=Kitasatospora sp. NPDC048365 TaxID=3364050 RepID=UPI00372072F3
MSEALDVAREFIAAANRGDVSELLAALAPEARVEMAGAVYEGRESAVHRFFVPWVVDVAGRYRETGAPTEDRPGEVAVGYRFATPRGLREDLVYTYRVNMGHITEIVGRFA